VLYTTDFARSIHTTTGAFADDTVILARHDDPVTASHKLQGHLDQLEAWLKKWRININATKYVKVTFTLRKEQCPVVHINNTVIPQSPTAKYLGLHLDSRLTWAEHLAPKKKIDSPKSKRLVLGHRKKISRIARKSTTSIQDSHKAYLDQ
jgi:hypothetical protein